jgi:hypothetical protein
MMHSLESRASRRPVSFHQYNDTSAAALEEAIDEITLALDRFQTEGYASTPRMAASSSSAKPAELRRTMSSGQAMLPPLVPAPTDPLPPPPPPRAPNRPRASSATGPRPAPLTMKTAPTYAFGPVASPSPFSGSLPTGSAPVPAATPAPPPLQTPSTASMVQPQLQHFYPYASPHPYAYPPQGYSYAPSPRDARVAWPPQLDAEVIAFMNSQTDALSRRPSSRMGSSMHHHVSRKVSASSSTANSGLHRRSSSLASSSAASHVPSSPFPAPSKPLPSVPRASTTSTTSSHQQQQQQPQRVSSQTSSASEKSASIDLDRFSQSSGTTSSIPDRGSYTSFRQTVPPRPKHPDMVNIQDSPVSPITPFTPTDAASSLASPVEPEQATKSTLEVRYWKQMEVDSRKVGPVRYLDVSTPNSTIASKHGNNCIRFWSVGTETVQSAVKFTSYTESRNRSRDYLIRSHAVLSEAAKLAAIATRFGRTVEIWNWVNKKRLQVIDDADRWAAGRFESYDAGWSPLAAYRGEAAVIDLYAATRNKKPFAKVRTIDLHKAGLPFIPQYPELALSPTSPLLVIACGPRTPRAGHAPPDRETLLVAWEIHDYRDVSNAPFRVVRPWQHRELDTAIPCSLATYDSLVVSLWIPAGHKIVPRPGRKSGSGIEYTLSPIPVPFRYVLVWDLAENSTRTYSIPNTTSCVSPDCRFVAYSVVAEKRSKLAVLDAMTGEELWAVGGEGNLNSLDRFGGDLAKVTDIAFSTDSRLLLVGDEDGHTSVYNVQEKSMASKGGNLDNRVGRAW